MDGISNASVPGHATMSAFLETCPDGMEQLRREAVQTGRYADVAAKWDRVFAGISPKTLQEYGAPLAFLHYQAETRRFARGLAVAIAHLDRAIVVLDQACSGIFEQEELARHPDELRQETLESLTNGATGIRETTTSLS